MMRDDGNHRPLINLQKHNGKMYCFSPPVMLATFVIEVGLMFYTLWRYRMTMVVRLAAIMFACLATFQMAEYMVCGGMGLSGADWARIGYVAITLLPPIGIHMAYALAGKRNIVVIGASYALAGAFCGYFMLAGDVFSGNSCMGNYVIFQLGATAAQLYTCYYYGLLLFAIGLSAQLYAGAPKKGKRALLAFIAGYVVFMLPTTVVNTIDPATIAGIPSIMCGFAVVLALVIGFRVVPLVGERNTERLSARHKTT